MQKMQEHFSALRCPTSCITRRDVGNADFAWSKNLSMQSWIPAIPAGMTA